MTSLSHECTTATVGIEGLDAEQYADRSYYERWAASMTLAALDRGDITSQELEAELVGDDAAAVQEEQADVRLEFQPGDVVRVHREGTLLRSPTAMIRRPHLRTPGYVHGAVGEVERVCGLFADPTRLAYRDATVAPQPLYRVRFTARALWPTPTTATSCGTAEDTVDVEIYQPWLQPASAAELEHFNSAGAWDPAVATTTGSGGDDAGHVFLGCPMDPAELPHGHGNDHDHDHGHGHGHGHSHSHGEGDDAHVHLSRPETEQLAVDREPDEAPLQPLAEALARLLVAKAIVTPLELAEAVAGLETLGKQGEGARLVARAWISPDFRKLLLADAALAAAELGITASNYAAEDDGAGGGDGGGARTSLVPPPQGHTVLTVVENTPNVHNMVVCTLCSCYPLAILGFSPAWYKSRSYRARSVREPRTVLAEFGLEVPATTTVRVHDSTADLRYLVLPARPDGTEGMTEQELVGLVTRDSMIGVGLPLLPR